MMRSTSAREPLAKGGNDREKVRTALEQTRNYSTASGVFSFSKEQHSGLAKDSIVLVNWANGRFNLADYQ